MRFMFFSLGAARTKLPAGSEKILQLKSDHREWAVGAFSSMRGLFPFAGPKLNPIDRSTQGRARRVAMADWPHGEFTPLNSGLMARTVEPDRRLHCPGI
jgi:hypothetical protein